MHTNKTLTKLFFRAGNKYSALSSTIFGSLLGTGCRIFRKVNESSSHMMACVFYSYQVAESKHGGYVQCLNIVHSTGKYCNRGQQHPVFL